MGLYLEYVKGAHKSLRIKTQQTKSVGKRFGQGVPNKYMKFGRKIQDKIAMWKFRTPAEGQK